MTDTIELNQEELKMVDKFSEEVRRELTNLGALRNQFLSTEKNITARISAAEQDFLNYFKYILTSKGLDPQEWSYDPKNKTLIKNSQ